MSEEEQEAIKNLKHIKQHWKPNKSDELATIEYESICICLNLIEKQQKEIEEQKQNWKELLYEYGLKCDDLRNSITKKRIEEKIEWLKIFGKINNSNEFIMQDEINLLEELLEENKNG